MYFIQIRIKNRYTKAYSLNKQLVEARCEEIALSLSLSPLRILSTSLSNEFKLVLNEQASIFSFSTPIIHSKSSPNVTTNIINTVKRDHRKEEKKKTISHHSRVISKSRKRSGKSEGERRNFFQTDAPTRYRCTRGQERMEEKRTKDAGSGWIRRGGEGGRAADNGTREREDRTHIHVGPRGVDFSGFPRELVVTVLAASRPQGESLVASPPAEIYFRNTAAGPLPPIHRSLPVRVNISRRRARLETFRELALASRTGKRTGIRPVPAFFPRETL